MVANRSPFRMLSSSSTFGALLAHNFGKAPRSDAQRRKGSIKSLRAIPVHSGSCASPPRCCLCLRSPDDCLPNKKSPGDLGHDRRTLSATNGALVEQVLWQAPSYHRDVVPKFPAPLPLVSRGVSGREGGFRVCRLTLALDSDSLIRSLLRFGFRHSTRRRLSRDRVAGLCPECLALGRSQSPPVPPH